MRVAVACERERRKTRRLDGDAEFFGKFAHECSLRRFAVFNFSARKLPEPGERLAGRALRKQNAIVGINQRDGYDKEQFQGLTLGCMDRSRSWRSDRQAISGRS